MGKLLFFDIDGTLVDFHGQMPDSARRALALAKEQGHELFICTGRSRSGIYKWLEDYDFDGYICSQGAHVEYHGEVISHHVIPVKALQKMLRVMEETGASYSLHSQHGQYTAPKELERLRVLFRDLFTNMDDVKMQERIEKVMGSFIVQEDLEHLDCVEKAVYQGAKVSVPEMRELLKPEFEVNDSSFEEHSRTSGEIALTGITKAYGIQKIAEYLGKDVKDTIAFGDGPNDPEMIEYAGIGVAMGNAVEELKQKADFITKPIGEDGIYWAMKELKLIK